MYQYLILFYCRITVHVMSIARLFIHSAGNRNLGWFYFLAIINNVHTTVWVQAFVWTCLHFSWIGTSKWKWWVTWEVSPCKEPIDFFTVAAPNLQSHQQCIKIPISPHPCQHLLYVFCPGKEKGNPLQYSCLENSMDQGAWQAIVWRLQSQTGLRD